MKLLRRFFKVIGSVVLLAILGFGMLYFIYNEPLPQGEKGPKADALAHTMLKTIQAENFTNTRFLEWSFNDGAHTYKWDKLNGIATVIWENNTVRLHLLHPDKSKVLVDSKEIKTLKRIALIEKATSYFNNDSFWLVAPFKVFDREPKEV